MNRKEAKNILLVEFTNNFDPTVPIAHTNYADFYLTSWVKVDKPTNAPWVRLFIQNDFTEQHTIGPTGGRRWERDGEISFQVFIPPNKGTYIGDDLCEQIIDIYEGKRLGGIVCKEGWYKEIHNNEEDLFQFNGSISFTYDETK